MGEVYEAHLLEHLQAAANLRQLTNGRLAENLRKETLPGNNGFLSRIIYARDRQ
jgi:hypothetical protein